MKSNFERISYLAGSVPELQNADNKRRKVLLTLLYWKIFDGIDIPSDTMKAILESGTNPETITRTLRRMNLITKEKEQDGRSDIKQKHREIES